MNGKLPRLPKTGVKAVETPLSLPWLHALIVTQAEISCPACDTDRQQERQQG